MQKYARKLGLWALIFTLAILGFGCDTKSNENDQKKESKAMANNVCLVMEDDAKIIIELDSEAAPITTANFLKLVKEGFYDGLTFHRAVPGFVIQGGDPEGNGMGGSDETIKGEFKSNGVSNPLKHERGVISMARSQHPDSASSQFFIVLETSEGVSRSLDGNYAAFGKVISGMDEVDRIAALPTTGMRNDSIVDQPVIDEAYLCDENGDALEEP